MSDTGPKADRLFRDLLMAKSGEERLAMGCAMFDDAKAIALAGLRAERPGMNERECRIRLFLRLYGRDFGERRLKLISARLLGA